MDGDYIVSNLNTALGYDNYGYLDSIGTGSILSYSYNFDPVSGNLSWRQNNKYSNMKENFYYDNLDRLDNIYMGTTMTLDMAYDASKGTMTTKTDVGTMLYNTGGKPYRLSSINPATSLTPGNAQTVTYTSFEKVSTISENNYNASFTYNSNDQRIKMSVLQGSSLVVTRWYPTGSFMKDSVSGSSKLYTYIGGDAYSAPCVAIRQGTLTRYYYLIRDHLGSVIEISDSTNTKLYEYSYDAWGRMRNPSTWANYAPGSEPALFTGRGFTGHEHLPWFNLINMNGRVYDPLIGQFPSPDKIIQNPGFTQNYNRYGYCFNNPLKYTDPSGLGIEDLLRESYYPVIQCPGYGSHQSVTSNGVTLSRNPDGSTTLNSALGTRYYANNDYYSYFLGMQPKGQNGNNRFNDYRVVGQRIWSGQMIPTPYGLIPEMLYYPGEVELGYTSGINDYTQGGGDRTQPLLPNSDVYWGITGASWLWGGTAALNKPHFRVDAASKAAGKLVGKVVVGLNVAATAAEGYDLVNNWGQAGRGDVAKFGVDATLTTVTTILYFTGVGAPIAGILTGVQIANSLGAFDSVYESFNEPMHGGGGSW